MRSAALLVAAADVDFVGVAPTILPCTTAFTVDGDEIVTAAVAGRIDLTGLPSRKRFDDNCNNTHIEKSWKFFGDY